VKLCYQMRVKKFFSPNITGVGRLIRFLIGCAFVFAGWLLGRADYTLPAILLFIGGGFVWFEAARGWCMMRACGVKTKW
jgi:hypothetical protein